MNGIWAFVIITASVLVTVLFMWFVNNFCHSKKKDRPTVIITKVYEGPSSEWPLDDDEERRLLTHIIAVNDKRLDYRCGFESYIYNYKGSCFTVYFQTNRSKTKFRYVSYCYRSPQNGAIDVTAKPGPWWALIRKEMEEIFEMKTYEKRERERMDKIKNECIELIEKEKDQNNG